MEPNKEEIHSLFLSPRCVTYACVFFLCAPFCLEECVQDCRVCVCLWELILGVSICSLSSKRWTSHSCLLGLPASSRSPSSSPPCKDTHWLTHISEFLSNNQCFFCFCFTLKPQVRWKLKILQLTTDCPGSLIILTDCYFYYSDIYTLQIAQQACFNIQSPDLKRPQPILKSVTLISTL